MRAFLRLLADRPVWCITAIGLVYLYFQSFIFPSIPIYQGEGAPIYLLEAERMLAGQWIYRDFFEFTLPGTQIFYLAAFMVFGARAWIPSATPVLLGTALAMVGVVLSKRVLNGRLVLLPGILFLAFALSSDIARDPTHHWFSCLAVMAAVALILEKRTFGRIAAAGVLCGLALLFTQNRGACAVLGIVLFLLWERFKNRQSWREFSKLTLCLAASSLAVVIPVIAFFAWKVSLQRFVYCLVIFPLKYWHKSYWNSPDVYMAEPPSFPFWLELPALSVWLFMHLLQPLVYFLLFARCAQQAKTQIHEPWDRLMLIGIVGLTQFMGIAFSPDWIRLCAGSLPALILFVWFIKSSRCSVWITRTVLWGFGMAILVAAPTIVQTDWHACLNSPVGQVALTDAGDYEKVRYLLARTYPGEDLFQADDANLYFVSGLRNPTEVSYLTNSPFTRPGQIRNVLDSLERRTVRFVVWCTYLDVPRRKNPESTLDPLRKYLHAHYHLVRIFPDEKWEEIWERN